MLPSSQFAIQQVSKVPFFANVGVRDIEDDIVFVSSWWEAMQHASDVEWPLIRGLPFIRRLNNSLEQPMFRVAAYRQFRDEIQEPVASIVAEKCAQVEIGAEYRDTFVRIVTEDITRYCHEIHTEDFEPLGFYTDLFRWYNIGHFPCGWEGEYPSGKLVIY